MDLLKDQEIVLETDGICQRRGGEIVHRVHRTEIKDIELVREDKSPLPWHVQIVGGCILLAVGLSLFPQILSALFRGHVIQIRWVAAAVVLAASGAFMFIDVFRKRYIMLIVNTNQPKTMGFHGMMHRGDKNRLIQKIEQEFGFALRKSK